MGSKLLVLLLSPQHQVKGSRVRWLSPIPIYFWFHRCLHPPANKSPPPPPSRGGFSVKGAASVKPLQQCMYVYIKTGMSPWGSRDAAIGALAGNVPKLALTLEICCRMGLRCWHLCAKLLCAVRWYTCNKKNAPLRPPWQEGQNLKVPCQPIGQRRCVQGKAHEIGPIHTKQHALTPLAYIAWTNVGQMLWKLGSFGNGVGVRALQLGQPPLQTCLNRSSNFLIFVQGAHQTQFNNKPLEGVHRLVIEKMVQPTRSTQAGVH